MAIVSLIAAIDLNFSIGYNNDLLFKNKEDMDWFKEHTIGKPCIMGHNTYKSIGSPLKDRVNIVLSGNKLYQPHPEILVRHSLSKSIIEFEDKDEIMIIGGQSIYEQAILLADRLYITKVHHKYDKADSWFPYFAENEWSEKYYRGGIKGEIPYSFHIYERIK